LMEGSQPVGAINRMEIIKAIAEKKYTIPLRELLQEELPAFTSSQSIESVLENLAGSNDRIFPVMEENQFIGVVNFPHIIEYLLLHKAESKEYGRIKSLAGLLR
ncbi:MAG TPA: CBS domain-containing protein, partial [Chitinophagaceae bacterium]|nr:CBS domain-containing protein [Chitinophagaceae bacterium]